jgi:AraC-like DNA-binding protein
MGQAEGEPQYRTFRFADPEQYSALAREAALEVLQRSRATKPTSFLRYEGQRVSMHHNFLPGSTIVRGAVDPGFLVLTLPLRWDGIYKRNGVSLEHPALLAAEGEACRSGENVETLSFLLRKQPLVTAALALAGPDSKVHELGNSAITGPPRELASLLREMLGFDEAVRVQTKALELVENRETLERGLITEVVALLSKLFGSSEDVHRLDGTRNQIVRRAEERFEAAGEKPVSLADLCVAAGVSARTLQYAFRDLYGMSPIQYFKVRRLHRARRALKSAVPERSAVKRAALESGLTDLGRFSVEYRALFGQSPSATLTEH